MSIIKPASANCNMDCEYCFYKVLSSSREKFSHGFMTEDTLEKLVREAVDYADNLLTFAFQGGEPSLRGLDFFRKAVELQKKYASNKPGLAIQNTFQTNGLLIDEEWCDFFRQESFLVGLSLDGTRKLHDCARLEANGKQTFERVMNAASLMKQHGVDFNILTVVTEQMTDKASAIYRLYKRNQFPFVQLIPCMDELNRNNMEQKNPYAVQPGSYGKFLCAFFDLWYEDFLAWLKAGRRGYVMDVRFFSNLAQMAAGYPPEECGMCGHCTCYFAVEGDGSVYPCDFYCMDEWKLGQVGTPFNELLRSEKAMKFIQTGLLPESSACKSCEYYSLCRGGCRRWREANIGERNINFLCAGLKQFYAHTWDRLQFLGSTIPRG
ncbi:MAG: anaerobic sulfatase maturase [Oscillospiraceae bacterium]